MKRAAIVTLSGYHNLGNRLQNYALQKTLESIGCRVETLSAAQKEENQCFPKLKEFSKKYIHQNIVDFNDIEKLQSLNEQYDYFIAGSDQVWNIGFYEVMRWKHVYFLQFAEPYKRISYAASFGMKEVSETDKAFYIWTMNQMAALSVREQAGAAIIKNLCARKAQVHVDPTMLLSVQEYEKLRKSHAEKPKNHYAVLFLLSPLSEEQMVEIQRFCAEKQCELVSVNNLLSGQEIGIEEFLDYIADAEYVFTTSFHCSVFSILFHRPFLVYNNSMMEMSSRIDTLLQRFSLGNCRYRGASSFAAMQQADFSRVEEIQQQEREKSITYLKKAMGLPLGERAFVVPQKEQCCGCSACAEVCPKQCITMQADDEGFLYPKIDTEQCIHCNQCKTVCPALHPYREKNLPQAYAAVNRTEEVRAHSSSGGVFSALAEKILSQGGVVFGAGFDENFYVQHMAVDTMEQLPRLMGSKYVQSDMQNCYQQAKELLDTGRKVFFTGTPCQIGGLKTFLKKEYPNLLTADLICHGVPSPLAWEKYIVYRERMAEGKLKEAFFRNKDIGWHTFQLVTEFSNGILRKEKIGEGAFGRDFLNNYNLRMSCYQCQFKTVDRCSDFTMADLWGAENLCPELDDNRGTSLLLVHSRQGARMLQQIAEQLEIRTVDLKSALLCNTSSIESPKYMPGRMEYFEKLKEGY